jgi:hypothetical protein
MQKTDLLSITRKTDFGEFCIESTDPSEVEYFGQLLIEKYGNKLGRNVCFRARKYCAEYQLADHTKYLYVIGEDKPYPPEVNWWLFSVALERGWQPFGEVGSFVRQASIEASNSTR